MSEVIPNLNSANVAAAFSWWLQEEIINSDEGRNAVLSEYRERRADLLKPITDPSNIQY
jgi:hypothetical protein